MIYFLDTEFNAYRGALLSMALVSLDGRELYILFDPGTEEWHPWVAEHVVPKLGNFPVRSPIEAALFIHDFIRDDPLPQIMCDWPTDIEWFCHVIDIGEGRRVLGRRIEFVIDPDAVSSDASEIPHNALADARAMRAEYLARYPQAVD